MATYKELLEYCIRHFDFPKSEVDIALRGINNYRCGLDFANPRLYEYMKGLVDEFIQENELPEDWFEDEFEGDIDKLFFEM